MATFRSIKELTRALQQGSKLLSNMFLQRKTIAVKYDDALDTLDGDENKLKHFITFGVIIIVKAMVNIMLINVFKRKISRKFGDFKLHCMMDEIGKLHPNNVEGILKFANVRNINLINSSPTTYNAQAYKYTYSLCKDEKSNTVVKSLLTIR